MWPRVERSEGEGVVESIASPTEILAAANGAIRVFDATTGKRIRELVPEESKRAITGLVWLRDGSVLASMIPDRAGDDTLVTLHRWAADGTGGFVTSLATGQRWMLGGIDDAALSPDGATIATGLDQIDLIDAKTGEPAGPPFGYQRESADSTATIQAITLGRRRPACVQRRRVHRQATRDDSSPAARPASSVVHRSPRSDGTRRVCR